MPLTRRSFFKTPAGGLTIAATPPTFLTAITTPARAESLTMIAAAVSIASTVAGLFAKSDGTREQFAILNAKLDHVIDLQNATLRGISVISNQLENIKNSIPQLLDNNSMKSILEQFKKLLDQLNALTARAVNREWDENSTRLLDKKIKESWELVPLLKAKLTTNRLGSRDGIVWLRFAMPAIFSAYQLVPTFRTIDKSIQQESRRLHRWKKEYEEIIQFLIDSLTVFSTNHLPDQLLFEQVQRVNQNNKMTDPMFKQWKNRLNSLVPSLNEAGNYLPAATMFHDDKLSTVTAFGPCKGGTGSSSNTDWAKQISIKAPPFGRYEHVDGVSINTLEYWTVFDISIPVNMRIIPLYYRTYHLGFMDVQFFLKDPIVSKFDDVHYSELEHTRRRRTALYEGFANLQYPVPEYTCPGMLYGDRAYYARVYADRSKDLLDAKLSEFRGSTLEWTEHSWNAAGIHEMREWAKNTITDLKRMKGSL